MITAQHPHHIFDDYITWRHSDQDGVSNHEPRGCLLNRLFRRRSNKMSKLRVTGLCVRNSPGPVNSPHKGPVTRKMFSFDDVIMSCWQNQLEATFKLSGTMGAHSQVQSRIDDDVMTWKRIPYHWHFVGKCLGELLSSATRGFPSQRTRNVEFSYFLWLWLVKSVEQTVQLLLIC